MNIWYYEKFEQGPRRKGVTERGWRPRAICSDRGPSVGVGVRRVRRVATVHEEMGLDALAVIYGTEERT